MIETFDSPIVAAGVQGLAAAYRAGETDPVAVTETYVDRIARYDARIGAFVIVDREGALAAARASRARWQAAAPLSPIDGVPIAIKANIAVAGLPWHAGIEAYRTRIAEHDAPCIARLRTAGAVLLGLVNLHEGAAGATTDNPAFGRTHNPWRHGYTAAGSSGGSGAAVAAGLAAAALGTDTAGSVRLPAAFTGSYGLKPMRGAISIQDVVPLAWTLDHVGIHARSAGDCALLFDILRRGGPALESGQNLRLAQLDVEAFDPVDAEIAASFARTIARAEAIGDTVERLTLPFLFTDLFRTINLVIAAEASLEHAPQRSLSPGGFSEAFGKMLDFGARLDAADIGRAHRLLASLSDAVRDALSGHDALLMPTAGRRPHAFEPGFDPHVAAFTLLGNVSGLPAIAFPAGLDAEGLPASVQALAWDEAIALRVADLLSDDVGAPPDYR